MWIGCQGTRVAVDTGPSAPSKKGQGPPPWAPAHGYRAKHQYRYYPSVHVYFDVGRRLYFYYDTGRWRMSASIPRSIKIDAEDYVTIEMDTANPYEHHADVVKRFPPGLKKRGKKNKGKNK
jgi:hypothetical protein